MPIPRKRGRRVRRKRVRKNKKKVKIMMIHKNLQTFDHIVQGRIPIYNTAGAAADVGVCVLVNYPLCHRNLATTFSTCPTYSSNANRLFSWTAGNIPIFDEYRVISLKIKAQNQITPSNLASFSFNDAFFIKDNDDAAILGGVTGIVASTTLDAYAIKMGPTEKFKMITMYPTKNQHNYANTSLFGTGVATSNYLTGATTFNIANTNSPNSLASVKILVTETVGLSGASSPVMILECEWHVRFRGMNTTL